MWLVKYYEPFGQTEVKQNLSVDHINWQVLSDEQMSKELQFSLLNDEQMSNWLGVEHCPVNDV